MCLHVLDVYDKVSKIPFCVIYIWFEPRTSHLSCKHSTTGLLSQMSNHSLSKTYRPLGPEGFPKGSRKLNSQNRDVSACLRNDLKPFLNTSGNLLGTSGQIGIKRTFKLLKFGRRRFNSGRLGSSANHREPFATFGNPSPLTRHLRKAFRINAVSIIMPNRWWRRRQFADSFELTASTFFGVN